MYQGQLVRTLNAIVVAHRDDKVSHGNRFATLVHGGAGLGKTESITQIATDHDMAIVAPQVGQLESGELIGIPREYEVNGVTVMRYSLPGYLPHYKLDPETGEPETWVDEDGIERKRIDILLLGSAVKNRYELIAKHGKEWYNKVKGVLIFFDEINRAADDNTKMAIFQLPDQYRIHTYEVPEHCVILAAANPSTDDYQVNEMDQEKAFMDRFVHLKFEGRTEDWMIWADKKGIHPGITSFINADPSSLMEKEEYFEINVKPSPRSWGRFMNTLMMEVELPQEDAILREVYSGVVGSILANNFVNHLKENMDKVVTAEEIIKDYKKVQKKVQQAVSKNRMDYLDQVTRNLYVLLAEEENLKKHKVEDKIENIEAFLGDLPPEVRMTLVQQLVQFDHVNELLGASDIVFEILNADAMKAHSSN